MTADELGRIITLRQGNPVPPGAYRAADNGRCGNGWPGPHVVVDLAHRPGPPLRPPPIAPFVLAPDRPLDATGTLTDRCPGYPASAGHRQICRGALLAATNLLLIPTPEQLTLT